MTDVYVLDSFAILAYFQDEPGAARFEELLAGALKGDASLAISTVNLGEVLYTIANRRSMSAAANGMAKVMQWPIDVVAIDTDLALNAARIKASQRMGYLDAFVVALAQRQSAVLVTGDPNFSRAEELVTIDWLANRRDP